MSSVTRSDRVIIAITVVVVLCLGGLSAFFFIADPFGAPVSSSSSRDDDEDQDEEPAEEEVDEDEESDTLLTLDDLASLSDLASVDGLDFAPQFTVFELGNSVAATDAEWGSTDHDDCYQAYAITSLIGEDDDAGSTELLTEIVGYSSPTSDFSDGYVGAFGRVLDSADDAEQLLEQFADAVEGCTGGFAVQRSDGFLSVDSIEFEEADVSAPSSVTAMTLNFSLNASDDITGFRFTVLQRGNAVVMAFAIVKPSSPFDESAADELASSLADGLADL